VRILNADEKDYLGDLTFTYTAAGKYIATKTDAFKFLPGLLSSQIFTFEDAEYFMTMTGVNDDSFLITVSSAADGTKTDDVLVYVPFEIRVRERGT